MSYDQDPPPEHVLITRDLEKRQQRAPDFESEARVLGKLSLILANHPDEILAAISDEVMRITQAESAGISIADVENGESVLRWYATSGVVKPYIGGTMPRDFSPCGVVLQIDSYQLMKKPAEYYKYIESLGLNVEELLLAPFHRNGVPHGTLWAIHHKHENQFDNEDARMLKSLAKFAGAATTILQARALAGEAQSELMKAIDHRDEFLSIASHELKTPLSSLLLQSQMFLKFVHQSPQEDYRAKATDLADMTAKQTLKLNRLVNEMLEVSRMKHGQMTFQKEDVDLSQLLREVVARNESQFTHPPVLVIDESCVAHVDRQRMEQVFQNLISNALVYGKGAPISIFLANDNGVRFTISDKGIGIPSRFLDSIFNRFDRGALKNSEMRGLGLGLYTAKQIVTGHGGKIWAESEPGQGSIFFIELPLRS